MFVITIHQRCRQRDRRHSRSNTASCTYILTAEAPKDRRRETFRKDISLRLLRRVAR